MDGRALFEALQRAARDLGYDEGEFEIDTQWRWPDLAASERDVYDRAAEELAR